MRLLQAAKISFQERSYDSEVTDGEVVAKLLGTDPAATFKTLVTVSDNQKHYVFVVPVDRELDLKAAARAVGERSISMLPQKLLFSLTGYVHGGCSPVGMKKRFATVFDETALVFDQITLSAGKRGWQVSVSPKVLIAFIGAKTALIARKKSKPFLTN